VSLHSPFWAPDAPVVIATATEALTAATLELMPKSGGPKAEGSPAHQK
jgi:hippurate hydrolase